MPSVIENAERRKESALSDLKFASEVLVDAMRECPSFRELIYDLAIEQGYVTPDDVR